MGSPGKRRGRRMHGGNRRLARRGWRQTATVVIAVAVVAAMLVPLLAGLITAVR